MELKQLNDALLKASIEGLSFNLKNGAFVADFTANGIPYIIEWKDVKDGRVTRDGLVIPFDNIKVVKKDGKESLAIYRDPDLLVAVIPVIRGAKPAETKTGKQTVEVWQLKDHESLHTLHFASVEDIGGIDKVKKANYRIVYSGEYRGEELDDLYRKFNTEIPDTYKGHSLSVSDVIVVKDGNTAKTWYVDSYGFTPIEKW